MAAHPTRADVGLYVHVAFCRRICFYCDFNTYVGLDALIEPYVAALRAELRRLPEHGRAVSLFLGGGTPSLLAPGQVASLVGCARAEAGLGAAAEVTLEANPCDLTAPYLEGIQAAGVNRLSLGVQSFHDSLLRRLGRRHDAREAREASRLARSAGLANLSLDLIFGLPGEDLAAWGADLEAALDLAPEHLSLYSLMVEEGTPFAKWAQQGKLLVPDEDAAADMYDLARERLAAAGYAHYEISSWARSMPGRDLRGQHNLVYWRNQPYLGVGAGAHSSFAGRRYHNVRHPAEYLRRIQAGESPEAGSEETTPELAMAETVILGLRLAEGVDRAAYQARFGRDLAAQYGAAIADLAAHGLLALDDRALRLTPRGQLLGNEVFQRFLPGGG